MRRAMLAIAIILLIASISACFGNQDITPEIDVAFIANPDRSLFYGETLTIATAGGQHFQLFARRYMDANPGVNIEITNLTDYSDDADRFANEQDEIGVQLMAGSAPALIDGAFVDHRDPRSTHFFVDWFPIMDADPNFDEDDWFMNVFHASAVNGRLHAFPLLFHREMVTANSTVPGLSEALAAQDSITLSELMELHRSISVDTSFLFDSYFDTRLVVQLYLDRFLDMETGFVDFNNEQFIDLIAYARELTRPNIRLQERQWRWWINPELEAYWSEKYFFSFYVMYQDLPRLETGPLFTELTPLVNECGELLVSPWATYVLNANATPIEQALAWDFIQFMKNPENLERGAGAQSPNRHLFSEGVESMSWSTIVQAREEFGW